MPDYDDIDRRDEAFEDRGRGDDRLAVARRRVSLPATLMQVNAAAGVILAVIMLVPFVLQPQMMVDWLQGIVQAMPPGPERDRQEQQVKQMEQQLGQGGAAGAACNAAQLLVFAALNVLVFVGAARMKQLRSYGLAMAAAIISLIPCLTGVCCTGIPFGLWAVIVLADADVKAAFNAAHRSSGGYE